MRNSSLEDTEVPVKKYGGFCKKTRKFPFVNAEVPVRKCGVFRLKVRRSVFRSAEVAASCSEVGEEHSFPPSSMYKY